MTEYLPTVRFDIDEIVRKRDAAIRMSVEAADMISKGLAMAGLAEESWRAASVGHKFWSGNKTLGDQYNSLVSPGFDQEKAVKAFRVVCDTSIWKGLFETTGLLNTMDATAKKELEANLSSDDPMEITEGNLRATFETLVDNAPMIWRRGIARAFSGLDRRFKSHDVFRFKDRVILTHLTDESGHISWRSHQRDVLIDIERVFAVMDQKLPEPRALIDAVDAARGKHWGRVQAVVETRYFRVKTFKNGNAHLWFTRKDLLERVNKELAAYYGDVLPDAAAKPPARERGTAVAKNLQFYRTPDELVDWLYDREYLTIRPGDKRILEPSAGDGALIKRLLKQGDLYVHAVEVSSERVQQLQNLYRNANSHGRLTEANFLTMAPDPTYDLALMNPPFYGVHWMDHVRHAWEFLRAGGRLIAILPATAEIGQTPAHEEFRAWTDQVDKTRWGRRWTELPDESFAKSGTLVSTVLLTMQK